MEKELELVTIYQNKKTQEKYSCFGEIPEGTKRVWLYSQSDDSGHSDILEDVKELDSKYEIVERYMGD